MDQRSVGGSDLRVSAIGLGCNNFGTRLDIAASRKVIDRALDLGITLFDTAPIYGVRHGDSEAIVGEALAGRRGQAVIVTKFGVTLGEKPAYDSSRKAVLQGIEDSLRRLRTDHVDLFMLHAPDDATPMEETLGALGEIVRAGKARAVACSNLPPARLAAALDIPAAQGLPAFVASENEYSLAERGVEAELVPLLERRGMGLLPYAPLANGLLTGKYADGAAPADTRLSGNARLSERYLSVGRLVLTERLSRFAQSRGRSLLDLAFSWLLARPVVAGVIAGASSVAQVERNAAAGSWTLTEEDIAEVDRICGQAA